MNDMQDKTIMETLKEGTRPLHDATEAHEFQKLLGSGKIERPAYTAYLCQLYLLHKHLAVNLEKASRSEIPESEKIKRVLKDRHLDLDNLTGDLAHFGIEADRYEAASEAVPGAAKLMADMEQLRDSQPCALLGILYVLEGSTHGAKYMAGKLRDGLGLSTRQGASYFDRYQENQMKYWLDFKATMNEVGFDETEEAAIVEAAKRTFAAFFQMGNELITVRTGQDSGK